MAVHKTRHKLSAVFICTVFITSWFGSVFHAFADDMAEQVGTDEPAAIAAGDPVARIEETGASYPSLQEAINALTGGETITLLSDITGTVRSSSSYTLNMNGHKIDGGGSGPVYTITGGTVTLRGGTVSGAKNTAWGASGSGGGIKISGATVTVDTMTITGNSATSGGGIYLQSGELTVNSSVITGNTASNGSGGGVYANSKVNLDGVRLEGNTATTDGAALYINDVEASVRRCDFIGNHGEGKVCNSIIRTEESIGLGAVFLFENCNVRNNYDSNFTVCAVGQEYLDDKPISLTLTGCEISGNTAVGAGGILLQQLCNGILNNTVVKNNKATGTSANGYTSCGGIVCGNSSDVSFSFNSGAIYNNTSVSTKAGDMFIGQSATVNVIRATAMTDAGVDLSNYYVWLDPDGVFIDENMSGKYALDKGYKNGLSVTAFNASTVPTAEYDGKVYESITAAIAAAENGIQPAHIKLLPGVEESEYIRFFYSEKLTIDIPVVLDMNACSLNARESVLFEVSSGASLTLSGAGGLYGPIYVKSGSSLELATDSNSDLSIVLEDSSAVLKAADNFVRCGNLSIKLNDTELADLNKTIKTGGDISYVLVENGKDKIELEKIEVIGLENILARITVVGNDIVVINHSIENDKFVSGSGNDDYNGTLDRPMKTVEEALKTVSDGGTIYILEPVTVTSEIWDGDSRGITITRFSEQNYVDGKVDAGGKNMITVTGSLELTNITVDGGGDSVYHADSIITLSNGAVLTLGDGAILQNNDVNNIRIINAPRDKPDERRKAVYASRGGAVYANSGSTINIYEGSSVIGCSAFQGGAIFCNNGIIIMDGGTFENNKAEFEGAYVVKENKNNLDESETYSGTGGAIVLNGSLAEMSMSGGSFINNSASHGGGGVSLGTTGNHSDIRGNNEKPTFTMTGGEFRGNTAGRNGGGLYVQSSYKAVIEAGDFIGNECGGMNFGGGAIYVNGGKSGIVDGELWVKNVLITENEAGNYGGGIAGCDTSGTIVNMTDGSIIYNNVARGDVKSDIAIATSPDMKDDFSHSKITQTQDHFTQYMMDGTPYHWKSTISVNGFMPGEYVSEEYLNSKTGKVVYTDMEPSIEDPKNSDEIKVRIIGNKSGVNGGGIGSNGSIFIGGPDYISPGKYKPAGEIKVSKVWEDLKDQDKDKGYPSDLVQLNIWVLCVDKDGIVRNKIHNPLIKDGEWRDSVTFDTTDIDENYTPVVLEEAVYKDGRHVWSAEGKAYEAAVKDVMDTMFKDAVYIWSDDKTSPYNDTITEDDGNLTFINKYIERSGTNTPPEEGETTEPSEPSDTTQPEESENRPPENLGWSTDKEDLSAGSGVLHEEELRDSNVAAIIVIISAASLTAAAVTINIIRRRKKLK